MNEATSTFGLVPGEASSRADTASGIRLMNIGQDVRTDWVLDPSCIFGIEPMDTQHDDMVRLSLAATALPLLERGAHWSQLRRALQDHFTYESELMASGGYTSRRGHEDDHAQLLTNMDDLVRRNDGMATNAVLEQVRAWLGSHLRGPDSDLARFVNEREIWDLTLECQMQDLDARMDSDLR